MRSGCTGESSSEPNHSADGSSAGVGRTGTFIALSSLFYPQSRVYETEDLDDFEGDPIAETIDIIRRSRNILVQAPGQLMLIYDMMDAYSAQ